MGSLTRAVSDRPRQMPFDTPPPTGICVSRASPSWRRPRGQTWGLGLTFAGSQPNGIVPAASDRHDGAQAAKARRGQDWARKGGAEG
eukprot:14110726-Alexandrium_andersonii.AAC.1